MTGKQELVLHKQQELDSAPTMQDEATQLVAHKRDAAEQADILRYKAPNSFKKKVMRRCDGKGLQCKLLLRVDSRPQVCKLG